jgi:butyrate response factor 1
MNQEHQVTLQNYKKELCPIFMNDLECKQGPRCRLAHGYQELHHFRNPNASKRFKTSYCVPWKSTGICPYSDTCRYAHGSEELIIHPTQQHDVRAIPKTSLCTYFMRDGTCKLEELCQFAHGYDDLAAATINTPPPAGMIKTQFCNFFAKNRVCRRGNTCNYAHDKSELRVADIRYKQQTAVPTQPVDIHAPQETMELPQPIPVDIYKFADEDGKITTVEVWTQLLKSLS